MNPPRRILLVAASLLIAITPEVAKAQSPAVAAQPPWPYDQTMLIYPTVIAVEFVSLEPTGFDSGYEKMVAHARVSEVLRDALRAGFMPCEIDVPVRRKVGVVTTQIFWTDLNLQPGMKYILMSGRPAGLGEMIAQPADAVKVSEGEDAIGDARLILSLAERPVAEQAESLATIFASGAQHSALLTQFIAAVLAAGSDADTAPLARSLDCAVAFAFSDFAKSAFIFHLQSDIRFPDDPARTSDNLIHTYVALLIRYFILDAHETGRGPLGLQDAILRNHLPRIRECERMIAALKRVQLSAEDLGILRREALRRQTDALMTEASRAEAGRLLEIFPER